MKKNYILAEYKYSSISCKVAKNSHYIHFEVKSILQWGCHDCMVVVLQLPMQSVPITTEVVSLNPAQAICTQYNII
jgi:hypothetical protein